MSPEDVEKWMSLLGIGSFSVGVGIAVFVFCVCNIEKLLLFYSWVQSLFTAVSSKARKGTISTSIRGNIIRACKNYSKIGQGILLNDLKIEWVKEENAETFIDKNQVIIRIAQKSNPHQTFVTAVCEFVSYGLLPKSKRYIDSEIMDVSKLAVSRSLILNGDDDALEYFDEEILLPILSKNIDSNEIFSQIKTIDGNGMFFGILLNEYSKASRKIYPDLSDPCLIAESREFLHYLNRIAMGQVDNLDGFCFNREYFKVHIFLTAKTETYKRLGLHPYLAHIFDAVNDGIETIYIFGLGKKIPIAEKLAEQAQSNDFRISKIKPHYYKHKNLQDGRRTNGLCYEVNVYKCDT